MHFVKTIYKYLTVVLVAGVLLPASRCYAFDFFGADVSDSDVPSIYFKVSLYGIRPIVNSVAFDSIAAKIGLHRGNVILSINGTDVQKTSELNQFTTNVLSVLILSGFEVKVVSIDRLASETTTSKANVANNTAVSKSRVAHDVPASITNAPPVTTTSRAPEIVHSRVTTSDPSPHQTSLEVLTRMKQPLAVPSPGLLRKEKQDLTIHEVPEKRSIIEDNRVSDKSSPTTPLLSNTVTASRDILTSPIKPAYDKITFENSKGNVLFRHSIHLKSLSKEQCMICHRTSNPTLESIQSRLANHRTAHSLCRGCHQKMEKGPTVECHRCHNG